MKQELPPLPYDYAALEPHVDEQTMRIHHDKHHQAYVTNLNAALDKHPELEGRQLDEMLANLEAVPEDIRMAVRNNGGGHKNHSFFWELMTPGGASAPSGELAAAIDSTFGGLDGLKEKVGAAAVGRFGSGWAWLVVRDGSLAVESTPNQDHPVMTGAKPVLGVDVWEHAYYLKYQNRRPDYVKEWWNTVNWDMAAQNYAAARS